MNPPFPVRYRGGQQDHYTPRTIQLKEKSRMSRGGLFVQLAKPLTSGNCHKQWRKGMKRTLFSFSFPYLFSHKTDEPTRLWATKNHHPFLKIS